MPEEQKFDKRDIERIIVEDSPETLVRVSRALGEELARGGLTTHQLRNLFGEVRRIAMEVELEQVKARTEGQGARSALSPSIRRRIQLLKPRMAYQAARIQKRDNPMRRLAEVLEHAINQIQEDPDRFERFVDFVEAIVAYHRYYQEIRSPSREA